MDTALSSNKHSDSLLTKNVYCVYFTEVDGPDLEMDELGILRKKYFEGEKKPVKVNLQNDVAKGFNGTLKGKMRRHSLYWKRTAGEVCTEESFSFNRGSAVIRRDYFGVLTSKIYFDREHNWVKSEYFKPTNPTNSYVMFKPTASLNCIERFDYDVESQRYIVEVLYPSPYLPGSAEQSVINAKLGDPPLVVSTEEGIFCYSNKEDATEREKSIKEIKNGTIVLMPAWEVKEGKLQGNETIEDASYTQAPNAEVEFSSLNAIAEIKEKFDDVEAFINSFDIDDIDEAVEAETTAALNDENASEEGTPEAETEEAKAATDGHTDTHEDSESGAETEAAAEADETLLHEASDITSREIQNEIILDLLEEAKRSDNAELADDILLDSTDDKNTDTTEGITDLGSDELMIDEILGANTADETTEKLQVPELADIAEESAKDSDLLPAETLYSDPEGWLVIDDAEETEEAVSEETYPDDEASPAEDEEDAENSDSQSATDLLADDKGGVTYIGTIKDGKSDGFGSHFYKDGTLCYAGFWKEDERDGFGVSFRSSDYALHISNWHEGKPDDMVTLFDKDGNLKYRGKIIDGKKQGAGLMGRSDGSTFIGKWVDGKDTGFGSLIDSEGNLVYTGMWKDGKRNGTGTEFNEAGEVVFSGEWKDDVQHNGILYKRD